MQQKGLIGLYTAFLHWIRRLRQKQMTRMPPTKGSNLSVNLCCPLCNSQMPSHAVVCSSCGEQVEQKQNGELESNTEPSADVPEYKAKTIRLVSSPQQYMKRWLSYQSQKNKNYSGHSQGNNPAQQEKDEAPTQPTASSQETASTDRTALHEPSKQVEPEQTSTTSHTLSKLRTWKSSFIRSSLLWPTIIILSALAAGLVNFGFTSTIIRPIVVFWFLFICPGMMVVRFLHLKEPVVEWTLAIALSFAIEAILAAIQLYSGRWSPVGTLTILIVFSYVGATIQLAKIMRNRSRFSHTEKQQE